MAWTLGGRAGSPSHVAEAELYSDSQDTCPFLAGLRDVRFCRRAAERRRGQSFCLQERQAAEMAERLVTANDYSGLKLGSAERFEWRQRAEALGHPSPGLSPRR